MRTILISIEDKKYKITFLEDGKEKWYVISYTLLSSLQELVYEWIEKRLVPPYKYA